MRYKGPVKGYIVLVNNDTGESTLHIVEPLHVNNKMYNLLNSEYGKLSVQFMKDTTFNDILYGEATNLLTEVSETLGTGDGSTTSFSGSFSGNIVPKSVEIYSGATLVATDDGDGNITGDSGITGTVDYTAGTVDVTYGTAPATGIVISAKAVKVG